MPASFGLEGHNGFTSVVPETSAISLYLDRCQIDTPYHLVEQVWKQIYERRNRPVGLVVDFGAGDGRFSQGQSFDQYIGYEIDPLRQPKKPLQTNATIRPVCAFSELIDTADICVGNPPYVRNQDLPLDWHETVSKSLGLRTGVILSGLANAWQYFFLLSLASTKADGLVALVIPYEWVSRPSVRMLREFIGANNWDVTVYRLLDNTFDGVMTTSSITIVDKRGKTGEWQYFEQLIDGSFKTLASPANSAQGVVAYRRRSQLKNRNIFAKRGLSPGTQKALVLTESARNKYRLAENVDVVPCITSLRPIGDSCTVITSEIFAKSFRDSNVRCWLVNVDATPSERLAAYLSAIPKEERGTATCLQREEWWRFTMPSPPRAFAATGFTGSRPKIASNECDARAVGSVAGIYGVPENKLGDFIKAFSDIDLDGRIVPHSHGFRKVEINQLNALIEDLHVTDEQ